MTNLKKRERAKTNASLISMVQRFSAQSAHYSADTAVYPLLSTDEILREAKANAADGILRFSIVTSGKRLSDREVEKVCDSFRKIRETCGISLCASMGLLSQKQFKMLKSAGGTSLSHCSTVRPAIIWTS